MSEQSEQALAEGLAMIRADMAKRGKPQDEIDMVVGLTTMIGRVQLDIGRIADALEKIASREPAR